jgi:hypothetical protein
VTFQYWPIVCTMFLENLTAQVRGDNTLLSYSEPFNDSQAAKLRPFARPLPPSSYERAWGPLFDGIWINEHSTWVISYTSHDSSIEPRWLESQLVKFLNGTTSTPMQKIAALEAGLQSITSVAYSLIAQQLRVNGSLASLNATVDVEGQQQIPLAMLHVNGAQTVLGLLCVAVLFLCVLYATEMRDGLLPREESHVIVGDSLDFMCLMRGSSLPELLVEPAHKSSTSDTRRNKAQEIDVV